MDISALNLRHLEAVAAIDETGSIAAATARVNLSQPAITQGLARLETQLDVRLFDRTSSGMKPTEAGRRFAERARQARRLLHDRRVTMTQILAFQALARGGSYPAAAAATGLRPASLHRAVRDLAWTIGAPLLERRGRGVLLTRRGLALVNQVGLALAELRSAVSELPGADARAAREVAVGAMPLSRARLLPDAIGALHAVDPALRFRIVEGSRADLIGPLRSGEIDLMVGALRRPVEEPDLVESALFEDRPVVVGRHGHPLADRAGGARAAEMAGFGWIVSGPGTPLNQQWRALFEAEGLPLPAAPVQSGSILVNRQMLLRSDLLSLVSRDQVAPELDRGALVVLGAPVGLSRTIGLTWRADWRPTPAQEAFIAHLRTQAEALIMGRAGDVSGPTIRMDG